MAYTIIRPRLFKWVMVRDLLMKYLVFCPSLCVEDGWICGRVGRMVWMVLEMGSELGVTYRRRRMVPLVALGVDVSKLLRESLSMISELHAGEWGLVPTGAGNFLPMNDMITRDVDVEENTSFDCGVAMEGRCRWHGGLRVLKSNAAFGGKFPRPKWFRYCYRHGVNIFRKFHCTRFEI